MIVWMCKDSIFSGHGCSFGFSSSAITGELVTVSPSRSSVLLTADHELGFRVFGNYQDAWQIMVTLFIQRVEHMIPYNHMTNCIASTGWLVGWFLKKSRQLGASKNLQQKCSKILILQLVPLRMPSAVQWFSIETNWKLQKFAFVAAMMNTSHCFPTADTKLFYFQPKKTLTQFSLLAAMLFVRRMWAR